MFEELKDKLRHAPFSLRHLWKERKMLLIVLLIVIVCIILGGDIYNKMKEFASLIEAVVLIVLFSLSYNELEEDRREKLEKRLTVIFHYEGTPIMVCERAYLAGRSDIRAWGQQLGLQMSGLRSTGRANGGDLEFEPFIEETSNLTSIGDKQYMHYTAIFSLRNIPWTLEDELKDKLFVHWVCEEKKPAKFNSPIQEYTETFKLPPLTLGEAVKING